MSVQVKGSGTIGGLDEGLNVVGVVTATSFSGALSGTTGTFSSTVQVTSGNLDIADSIRHVGDSDTKMRFPTADTISFETAGTERIRITSTGLVGIKNSSPQSQYFNNLVVGDNSTGDWGITIRTSSSNMGVLAFSDTDSADANRYDGYISYVHSDQSMRFNTGGANERLRITSVGDVGIGTAIPVVANNYGNLSLAGSTGGQLELKRVSDDIRHYIWGNQDLNIGGGYINGSSSNIIFRVNGATERLRITSTGILVTGNGTAPNSTDTGSIFMPGGGDLGWLTSSGSITFNAYYNGGWKYVTSGTSHILWASSEGFNFSTASSGSANGNISYSRAMKIFTNNRVSIGDGNGGQPLGALHIDTKSTMGTDTALWIGDNSAKRYMAIQQTSGSEQFSHIDLYFNDNGSRSMINLQNPYGPAGYGSGITWKGYNGGTQGYIECKSEGANSATGSMYLNTTSGTFLKGNSSRHVTMPQQPSFAASRTGGNVGNGNTIVFNSVKFNVGSHYNNSNGRFTAPTAGKYQFSFGGMAYGTPGDFQVRIRKNGSNYFNNNGSGNGNSTFEPYGFTVLMDMVVGDYADIYVYSSTSAVVYGTGSVWNIFSGHLVS